MQLNGMGHMVKRPVPFWWMATRKSSSTPLVQPFSTSEFIIKNPIVKRCAGPDIHKMRVAATLQPMLEDGNVAEETRSFGTFSKHRRQLCRWLKKLDIALVVRATRAIFFKSIYESLEDTGLQAFVVNARHVKQFPGRKTDVKDSQWPATLGRYGLLRPSFIPPRNLPELGMLTRQRQKILSMLRRTDCIRHLMILGIVSGE
ncbi:MAG: hypothetical protein CSA33_08850 [Desulfobulbus propionicus]|nr:MAG: hypothetical protein CSA33_08850 [Desulfobulbus propionicus]